MVLEGSGDAPVTMMVTLLKVLWETGLVTLDQMNRVSAEATVRGAGGCGAGVPGLTPAVSPRPQGFQRVYAELGDISLDVPLAHGLLERLVELCFQRGIITRALRDACPARYGDTGGGGGGGAFIPSPPPHPHPPPPQGTEALRQRGRRGPGQAVSAGHGPPGHRGPPRGCPGNGPGPGPGRGPRRGAGAAGAGGAGAGTIKAASRDERVCVCGSGPAATGGASVAPPPRAAAPGGAGRGRCPPPGALRPPPPDR